MFLPKTNRKILPRWRDFWTTAALGQLSPAAANTEASQLPRASEIESRSAWRLNQTLWHALDLVGSALVDPQRDTAVLSAVGYIGLVISSVMLIRVIAQVVRREADLP